jgi:hypothetical protein
VKAIEIKGERKVGSRVGKARGTEEEPDIGREMRRWCAALRDGKGR